MVSEYRWSQEQVSLHGAGTVLYVGMGGYGVPTTGNAPWSRDCTVREAWGDMGCLRQVMLHGAGTTRTVRGHEGIWGAYDR